MQKISVIIPVYNVEKYLRQCLDSVINQTYKNLEIICVNDCSTDSSPEILNEYASKDSRILVLHNDSNVGLGLTRNHGMKYATGDYVHFLDSDDYLELNAYETLSQNLSDDIVYFLWNNVDIKRNKVLPQRCGQFNVNDKAKIVEKTGINVWHGVFSREFLTSNSLIFNDYRCMEDIEFTYKAIILTDKISFLNKQILNYRINNSESLIGKFHKFYYCVIDSYNTVFEFSECMQEAERSELLAALLNSVLYRLIGSYVYGELSYQKLLEFCNGLDLTVFKKDIKSYKWFKLYNEIVKSTEFMLKFRYKLKLYLRENFYWLYEFLKKD